MEVECEHWVLVDSAFREVECIVSEGFECADVIGLKYCNRCFYCGAVVHQVEYILSTCSFVKATIVKDGANSGVC